MSPDLMHEFRIGPWKVEPLIGAITDPDGEVHHLEPKVMDVFVCLAQHPNDLVTRDELLQAVWGEHAVSDEPLTRVIGELRRALHDDRGHPHYIKTIPKRGYGLIGEVRLPDGSTEKATIGNQLPQSRTFATVSKVLVGAMLVVVVMAISDYFEAVQPVVADYKIISSSPVVMPPVSSPLAITADDSRLYFTQFLDGELTLSQLAQSGGKTTPLNLPFGDSNSLAGINGMTPDKSNFLIEHYPGVKTGPMSPELWMLPAIGGSARRLGKGRQGVFSPSGNRLLFMKDSVNMFIANSDMTEPRKIATLPNRVYWPRFSPDGMRIRFTQYLDQFASNLWELRLDGGEPYRLLPDWQGKSLCCGSWTPDGKYYVFQARADESTQLWAIENADDGGIDSSEPFQITSGAIDFLRPTISADGKTIFAVGWQLRGEILEYENATGKFSPVPGLESMSVEQASYSRDHQSVAYISYPDGTLWHKKINENESQQLTYEPMQAAQPVWSPDGSKIAFTGWMPGEPYKIYIVPANGGDPSLISDGDSSSWSPSWSSDGARMVFSDAANDQLQVYDLKLATTADMPGTSGARSPTWSFDGKSIAARSGTDLINYDVNSQTSTVLLENVRYNFKYWSGDSDALYLVDSFLVGRERSVYRLNIEDKKLSKIAVVGTLRNTWGTVGQWVGVSPDGTPLLLRDQSIHNIYALKWESD